MCGGATDLSLLALLNKSDNCIFISTCCHHRCTLDTYCNLKFLKYFELTDEEIEILFMLSSWAVNNLYRTKKKKEEKLEEEEKIPFFQNLNTDFKTLVGFKVKRILDIGRCLFIREKTKRESFMKQFCNIDITPENFVIVSP